MDYDKLLEDIGTGEAAFAADAHCRYCDRMDQLIQTVRELIKENERLERDYQEERQAVVELRATLAALRKVVIISPNRAQS